MQVAARGANQTISLDPGLCQVFGQDIIREDGSPWTQTIGTESAQRERLLPQLAVHRTKDNKWQ